MLLLRRGHISFIGLHSRCGPYNLMHMSLITRCTACGTLFKVVPDQLKMGDGWVRCGHCAEVFDASAHLQTPAALPEVLPLVVATPDAPDVVRTPADTLLDEGIAADESAPGFATDVVQPWGSSVEEEALAEPSAAGHDPHADPVAPPPEAQEDDTPSALLLHTATHDGVEDADAVVVERAATEVVSPEEADAAPPGASDFSFVRQAERQAFWRRPLVRWLLLFVCLGLLGVLGFQAAVQHRNDIAARVPALRPVLEAVCQRLGCEVSARRHIESVVIDSSSFNKGRGDTYQLGLTLKNTATTVLATPSIELTLTDVQDQAILRRVLQPADLGVAPELPAQGDATVSLPIGVAGEAGSARIAGYRLLAFYP